MGQVGGAGKHGGHRKCRAVGGGKAVQVAVWLLGGLGLRCCVVATWGTVLGRQGRYVHTKGTVRLGTTCRV